MREFRVGDVIECFDVTSANHITVGTRYEVLGFDCDGDPEILNENGDVCGYMTNRFKLVPNAMPELEAGMIVEYDSMMHEDETFLALWVSGAILYRVGDDNAGNPVEPKPTSQIVSIYRNHGGLPLYSRPTKLNLIWERKPELTETQLKIAELREKLEELEVIAEKEAN